MPTCVFIFRILTPDHTLTQLAAGHWADWLITGLDPLTEAGWQSRKRKAPTPHIHTQPNITVTHFPTVCSVSSKIIHLSDWVLHTTSIILPVQWGGAFHLWFAAGGVRGPAEEMASRLHQDDRCEESSSLPRHPRRSQLRLSTSYW